jgi:isomerase DpgB
MRDRTGQARPAAGSGRQVVIWVTADAQISVGLRESLTRACHELEQEPMGRVLVLRLTGDRRERIAPAYPPDASVHDVNKWEKTLRRIECLPVPVVCVLEGACIGLGFEMALACDVRIARVGTRIGLVPLRDGGIPGMAAVRLARELGAARARRFTLLGADVAAEEAEAIGLIDIVSDEPETDLVGVLDRATAEVAQQWAMWRRVLIDESAKEFDEVLGVSLAASDHALRGRRALA